jgi:hypothetical protein
MQLLNSAFRHPSLVDPDAPQLSKLGVKVQMPSPYDGSSNIEVFENWLGQLLDWFRLYNLDPDTPAMDRVRSQLLSQALTGHKEYVREAHETRKEFTFRDAVLALQKKHLHKATELEAVTRYEGLTQGSRDVRTLYDDLKLYASRMSQKPSSYDFKRRFMKALKPSISTWVISMGLSPEKSPQQDLLAAALSHEESLLYQQVFVAKPAPVAPVRPPGGFANNSKGNKFPVKNYNSSGRLPTRPDQHMVGNSQRCEYMSQAGPSGANHKPSPGLHNPKKADHPHGQSSQPTTGMAVRCYNCGGLGHISPNCPQPKWQQKGFAAQIIEKDDQEVTGEPDAHQDAELNPAHEEPQDENPEGEQYDPDNSQEEYRFSDLSDQEVEQPQGYGAYVISGDEACQGYAARVIPWVEEESSSTPMQAFAVKNTAEKPLLPISS